MERYINANALLTDLREQIEINNARGMAYCDFELVDLVNEQPTAPVKEVVRGANVSESHPVDEFICSECGIILEGWVRVEINEDDDNDKSHCEYVFKFCPNCGEDVRGVE